MHRVSSYYRKSATRYQMPSYYRKTLTMDQMPSYYRKTADKAVRRLIDKQYPEDEFVLDDDDVIVLTKVDIRINNPAGETDESDEESGDELKEFYIEENYDSYSEDDMEDFIDDRPEDELTEYSGNEEEEAQVEGKEYDSDEANSESENQNENENQSENEDEDENENENGNVNESEGDCDSVNSNRNGTKNDNKNKSDDSDDDDDDDDDDEIPSPRKKLKLNAKTNDEKLNNEDEEHNSNEEKIDVEDEEESSESDSDIGENSEESSSSDDESKVNAPRKEENKFGVYLLPKIYGKRARLQYHGRIGMPGLKGFCRPKVTKPHFCNLIRRKRVEEGYTRVNLMFVNARHLENRKAEITQLPRAVRKLLIHLIDQWFPVGIPQEIHMDRAINLLEILKRKIEAGKIPNLKHSNKFYELIPHQGDCCRRPRLKTVELCDNKMNYIQRMKSAIDCFETSQKYPNDNPLEYFLENWLEIDLRVLSPDEQAYKDLKTVVENTQHPNAPRCFDVTNIFHVENLNRKTTNEFQTTITENHRYLFHFTFASNLLCILREGLLVAPKHIHSVNRFLGDGIYFWDAVANAGLNYKSLNTVYILVCRVALGKVQEVEQQYLEHDQQLQWDEGSDSIFCAGKQFTSSRDAELDFNGAKIYSGKLDEKIYNPFDRYSLYNEYVVHNENQVKIEYIVKLELHKDD